MEINSSSYDKLVWDCGSSLYDSFELDSLRRRLDSAIAARSLSMPHLAAAPAAPAPPPPPTTTRRRRRLARLPGLLRRALRAVLLRARAAAAGAGEPPSARPYDRAAFPGGEGDRLAPIPEASEKGSPELFSSSGAARRTASERFAAFKVVAL